jgi:hypothetical protein
MKPQFALPLAALASLALVGACQKPAAQTATDAATTTTAAAQDATAGAANATANATDSGGAVSPPAANGAVNADGNKGSTDVASASNSFTESQAKGHIEKAGYGNVAGLTKTPDGLWTGTATKDGKPVTVAVDFKGAVTAK